LYAILPYDLEPGYTVYKAGKVVGQMQLLLFSALVFFLFLPLLKRTDTIALEVDWFYRKGGRLAYALADKTFNGINAVCARATSAVTGWLARTCTNLPQRIVQAAATPYYALLAPREAESARNQLHKAVQTGFVGVGPTLIAIFLGLALLLALAL
jgi:multicomponent Na+:H+ antiporter subunit D